MGEGLPEYTGTPEQVSEPKGEELTEAQSQTTANVDSSNRAPDVVDLDKLERFRFSGKEYTRDDWNREWEASHLRQSDYTTKTKQLAEERKQWNNYKANFGADLAWVSEDPQSRLARMKNVYPAEFVELAESLLKSRTNQTSPNKQSLPPEMQSALDEISQWKESVREQEKQAALQKIDALHDKYASKYPFADSDVVDTRVSIALESLELSKSELEQRLASIYEQAYKQHNDQVQSRIKAGEKVKVEEQVKAGRQARDIGTGGSTPGHAPKKYKSLKEVGDALLGAVGGK